MKSGQDDSVDSVAEKIAVFSLFRRRPGQLYPAHHYSQGIPYLAVCGSSDPHNRTKIKLSKRPQKARFSQTQIWVLQPIHQPFIQLTCTRGRSIKSEGLSDIIEGLNTTTPNQLEHSHSLPNSRIADTRLDNALS